MDFGLIKSTNTQTTNQENTYHSSNSGHVATPNHQQHAPSNHFYKEYTPPPHVPFHLHIDKSYPYEFEPSSGSYQQRYHQRNGIYNDRTCDTKYHEHFHPNSYSSHNFHPSYKSSQPMPQSPPINPNTYNENTNNYRNRYPQSDENFKSQINHMCDSLKTAFHEELCHIKDYINTIKDVTMKDSSENQIISQSNGNKLTKSNVPHTHLKKM